MPKLRVTWGWKLSVLLLFFSVAPMLVVATESFHYLRATSERMSQRGLQALARAKAESVDAFTDLRRRDVERIAGLVAHDLVELKAAETNAREKRRITEDTVGADLPMLQDAEKLPPTGEPKPAPLGSDAASDAATPPQVDTSGAPAVDQPETTQADTAPTDSELVSGDAEVQKAQRRLKQTLGLLLWDQRDFEELLVIDSTGRVLASTFEGHEGKNAANVDYFQSGGKATYLQPVFISPITQQLTMVIATPVRDAGLNVVGVLAARLNLTRFFRLINDSTGLGRSGETVVAKLIDDQVVFMAPTRHDARAVLERRIPVGSDRATALQEAARGLRGSGIQNDYRGTLTVGAWEYVPSLGWGLLTKIDYQEVNEGVSEVGERGLWLILVVVLLIVPTTVFTTRALLRPLRALKDATDRLSRGDFGVQLNIRSNDEIGELADSFDRMVAAIKFFRERSLGHDDDDEEEDELESSEEGPPPSAI